MSFDREYRGGGAILDTRPKYREFRCGVIHIISTSLWWYSGLVYVSLELLEVN